MNINYKRFSVRIFGNLADRLINNFKGLKMNLLGASINILLKTWVSVIFMSTFLAYTFSLIATSIFVIIVAVDFITFLYMIIFVPILAASVVFFVLYLYPVQRYRAVQKSIDLNIPFALSHMSAIASSGIPPEFIFELLTKFDEYGEIANQSKIVVRNIKAFGMSSVSAINNVAERTPSEDFRDILTGISATIEKGGNLVEYIKDMSNRALFNYRLKREKYMKTLSTYADIYTALLVAAPLMMLAILGIMGIIGGSVLGLTISDLMLLMTWVMLPILNISFLAFVHITYPGT
jgi:flagellar protein FlaJ